MKAVGVPALVLLSQGLRGVHTAAHTQTHGDDTPAETYSTTLHTTWPGAYRAPAPVQNENRGATHTRFYLQRLPLESCVKTGSSGFPGEDF